MRDELMGDPELEKGHSTWIRDTESKTSQDVQQPLDMRRTILQWWNRSFCGVQKMACKVSNMLGKRKSCISYVSYNIFSAVTGCVEEHKFQLSK